MPFISWKQNSCSSVYLQFQSHSSYIFQDFLFFVNTVVYSGTLTLTLTLKLFFCYTVSKPGIRFSKFLLNFFFKKSAKVCLREGTKQQTVTKFITQFRLHEIHKHVQDILWWNVCWSPSKINSDMNSIKVN